MGLVGDEGGDQNNGSAIDLGDHGLRHRHARPFHAAWIVLGPAQGHDLLAVVEGSQVLGIQKIEATLLAGLDQDGGSTFELDPDWGIGAQIIVVQRQALEETPSTALTGRGPQGPVPRQQARDEQVPA